MLGFISNAEAEHILEEVIHTHAARILGVLGLAHDNDGILDRIFINHVSEENPAEIGWFGHTMIKTYGGRSIFPESIKYDRGTGHIKIYLMGMLSITLKSGKQIWNPVTRFNRKALTRFCIHVLAHELRHYWQFYTGEIWEHRLKITGQSLIPYQHRWEEKDANEFADEYYASVTHKQHQREAISLS